MRRAQAELPEHGQVVKSCCGKVVEHQYNYQDSHGSDQPVISNDLHVHLHKLVTHLHSLCGWDSLLE